MIIPKSPQEEALEDMKGALAFDNGEGTYTAFNHHYMIWRGATVPYPSSDAEYASAVIEIYEKFGTEECLLKGA